MSLTDTPNANRLHIALFGRRNSGKSSLINALTGQDIALVSNTPGTTTDLVSKAMEIQGIGPCLFIDTPGFDDEGELGELRISRTLKAIEKTDIALLLCEDTTFFHEKEILALLKEKNIPVIPVLNKIDIRENSDHLATYIEEQCKIHPLLISAKEKIVIAGREFNSRLFLGTGKFNSNEVMEQAILASGTEMVTVAMKRIDMDNKEDDMLKHIIHPNIQLLPNTSGVRNAEEAVFAAQLAREAFGTNWLKLEIHPDPRYLLPDSIETLKATEELVKLGFIVLPYCQADPVLCKRLEEAGAATVMPLGAPIGTNKGLQTKEFLQIIIEQAGIPVVVDAGIGAPSHAAEAMELGASAVLVNTAIAVAGNPVEMAKAFKAATEAGRQAYEAGLGLQAVDFVAEASSPLTAFLD